MGGDDVSSLVEASSIQKRNCRSGLSRGLRARRRSEAGRQAKRQDGPLSPSRAPSWVFPEMEKRERWGTYCTKPPCSGAASVQS